MYMCICVYNRNKIRSKYLRFLFFLKKIIVCVYNRNKKRSKYLRFLFFLEKIIVCVYVYMCICIYVYGIWPKQ